MAGIQKWHVLFAGSLLLITVQRELDTERLGLIFYVLFCFVFVLQTAIHFLHTHLVCIINSCTPLVRPSLTFHACTQPGHPIFL
jgi:hypothetical protein